MADPRYVSPSTGRPVRAVLFDTFGTVVDWRTGVASAAREFVSRHDLSLDAESFADEWRAQYQPAMEQVRTRGRDFILLDVLHRENLDEVLRAHELDPAGFDEAELAELARCWRYLPPWPDSVTGIAALRRHYIVGPLSNGHTALLLDMAKAYDLPWDLVLGSDIGRAYKPDPVAYRTPAQILGIDPGEVMLVAAHNGDLQGARDAGLATAFVARPTEHGPGQTRDLTATSDWDAVADSITSLAVQLHS
ncbi:MAG: haloacid dehalogenase [Frankiales bacterium]|nr:haloacid dehalogenase [Frankiales bacterium]